MDLLERFFAISSQLLMVTDERGRIRRANPRWRDVLGYEPDQLENRLVFDLVHPDDVPRTRQAYAEIHRRGEYRGFENRCSRKDGGVAWIKWRGSFDPETGFFYGSGTDVTPEKRPSPDPGGELPSPAGERERSTVLRQLIEISSDGCGYCDSGLKPLYMNRFLTDGLGWPVDTAHLFDRVSASTRARYEAEMIPAVLGRLGSWEGEVEFVNVLTG